MKNSLTRFVLGGVLLFSCQVISADEIDFSKLEVNKQNMSPIKRPEPKRISELRKEFSETNSDDIQFELAKEYFHEKMYSEAGEELVQLTTKSYSKAFAPLGLLYAEGYVSDSIDCKKAVYMIFGGVAEKECNAYQALSYLYKKGLCVKGNRIDLKKSRKYEKKASECMLKRN